MGIIGVIAMFLSFGIMVVKFRTHSKYLKLIGANFSISTFYEIIFARPIKIPEDNSNEQIQTLITKINKLTYSFYVTFAVYLILAYTV